MQSLLDELDGILPLLLTALIGVGANILRWGWRGLRPMTSAIAAAIVGAFAVGMFAPGFGLDEHMQFGLAGLMGYSGGTLVDVGIGYMLRRMGRR